MYKIVSQAFFGENHSNKSECILYGAALLFEHIAVSIMTKIGKFEAWYDFFFKWSV